MSDMVFFGIEDVLIEEPKNRLGQWSKYVEVSYPLVLKPVLHNSTKGSMGGLKVPGFHSGFSMGSLRVFRGTISQGVLAEFNQQSPLQVPADPNMTGFRLADR